MSTKKKPCAACGHVDADSPLAPFGPDGRWRCPGCKRMFHFFCSGAVDDIPEVCDDCWVEEHKEDAA